MSAIISITTSFFGRKIGNFLTLLCAVHYYYMRIVRNIFCNKEPPGSERSKASRPDFFLCCDDMQAWMWLLAQKKLQPVILGWR